MRQLAEDVGQSQSLLSVSRRRAGTHYIILRVGCHREVLGVLTGALDEHRRTVQITDRPHSLSEAAWNTHLKSHAANRLRSFFTHAQVDVPNDLFGGTPRVREKETDIERHRRHAHRYIDAMTGEELARLSIEIAVVARVQLPAEG